MKRARTIMLQGTASDVGKSLLATALCRIFRQDGYAVAPFKSQNMSLNSYVTVDGQEIGQAQGMQADACQIVATTDMNPILLKPSQDMVSQVIVHGKPYRELDARTYREEYLEEAGQIVRDALERLRRDKDIVVIEGAGSPAEINLKDRDIVNMNLAKWADAPVILVADIDRGGVFASIVGTLELLTAAERAKVSGFIINKFRGDISLLQPGLDWLEHKTGKPVYGVIPYLSQLELEEEDSASLDHKMKLHRSKCDAKQRHDLIEIGVVKLPRMANFADLDPLLHESDVHMRFIDKRSDWEELGAVDAVIIPGSQHVYDDLLFLRKNGFVDKLQEYVVDGGYCVGFGSGYSMLGERLKDPKCVMSRGLDIAGLGLLPFETTLESHQQVGRVSGTSRLYGKQLAISGFKLHLGEMELRAGVDQPFLLQCDSESERTSFYKEGVVSPDGRVWGTHMHGILHHDLLRRTWLNQLRLRNGWTAHPEPSDFGQRRERAFDRLADHVRQHLDLHKVYALLR